LLVLLGYSLLKCLSELLLVEIRIVLFFDALNVESFLHGVLSNIEFAFVVKSPASLQDTSSVNAWSS